MMVGFALRQRVQRHRNGAVWYEASQPFDLEKKVNLTDEEIGEQSEKRRVRQV